MGMMLNTASGGGDFLPILKYDAKAGRFFRVDRTQDASGNWSKDDIDITNGFQAIMDLANVEVGWVAFGGAGQAPDFRVVPLKGLSALPASPGGMKADGKPLFQQCFRMKLKLGKSSGGDVREFAHSAKSVIVVTDALYDQYEAAIKADAKLRDMLPVVACKSTDKKVSGSGAKSSTAYAPKWEIVKWVDRPPELANKSDGSETYEDEDDHIDHSEEVDEDEFG